MTKTLSSTDTLQDIATQVRQCGQIGQRILPVGNGTKPHLSTSHDSQVQRLSMAPWSGIVDYQPFEFTITAKSGTRMSELKQALEASGQFLPFDPILISQGATLGGTIAAGVSGPGRLLFGGLRDFVLGVQLIDGLGHLVRGGGKVVKNAAGFDLPKMMVGSLGRLGILTEVTLKVFPKPIGYRTLKLSTRSLGDALGHIGSLMRLPIDVVAVELDSDRSLFVRVAGDESTTSNLARRICEHLGMNASEEWNGAEEAAWWADAAELRWAEDAVSVVRVPITSSDVEALDRRLERLGVLRRYSAALNAVWIAACTQQQSDEISGLLRALQLKGLVIRGTGPLILGDDKTAAFAKRIQQAIDPANVFAPF